MVPREVHVADSKFLVLILRRKPEEIGISLDEQNKTFTHDMLEEIVAASSRATGCVGQTCRALPGKEIPLRATTNAQGL